MNFTKHFYSIGIATSILLTVPFAQAEIKIGIAGPLSGPTLNIGEQQEIGVLRAIADLNAKGGLLGQEIVICFTRRCV